MKTTKTKRNQNRSPDYHGVQHAQLSRCDAMPWHAMLMSIYAHFWSALHHNSHSDFMFNWLIVSNRKIGVSACVPNLLRKLNETPRSFGIFRSFPEIDWLSVWNPFHFVSWDDSIKIPWFQLHDKPVRCMFVHTADEEIKNNAMPHDQLIEFCSNANGTKGKHIVQHCRVHGPAKLEESNEIHSKSSSFFFSLLWVG